MRGGEFDTFCVSNPHLSPTYPHRGGVGHNIDRRISRDKPLRRTGPGQTPEYRECPSQIGTVGNYGIVFAIWSACLKSAVKALPLKVDDLLVDIYYHFQNRVNRIVSLREVAEFCCVEFKSILKHCETRWLSLLEL